MAEFPLAKLNQLMGDVLTSNQNSLLKMQEMVDKLNGIVTNTAVRENVYVKPSDNVRNTSNPLTNYSVPMSSTPENNTNFKRQIYADGYIRVKVFAKNETNQNQSHSTWIRMHVMINGISVACENGNWNGINTSGETVFRSIPVKKGDVLSLGISNSAQISVSGWINVSECKICYDLVDTIISTV